MTFIQFQGQLTLYEISNFPLLGPRDNQSTIISLDHCAVLYNSRADIYVPFTTTDILPSSPVIDIAATDLNLQTKSRQHCLIAVLEGTDHNIHEFCKFRVIDSLPEPAVLRLSPSQVFITRIPTISVTCNSITREIKTPQIQVVYSIPCGCILEAANKLIANINNECNDLGRPNFTFPVNLKIMYHFFQSSIAEWRLTADTLVDEHIDIVIPKLLVKQQEIQDNLAIQKIPQFDLNAVINKSREDIKSYASLSHILLHQLERLPIAQSE